MQLPHDICLLVSWLAGWLTPYGVTLIKVTSLFCLAVTVTSCELSSSLTLPVNSPVVVIVLRCMCRLKKKNYPLSNLAVKQSGLNIPHYPFLHTFSEGKLVFRTYKEITALSKIYPHSNWKSKLNAKLRLEFQVKYRMKLEFQVELLIRRESVVFTYWGSLQAKYLGL